MQQAAMLMSAKSCFSRSAGVRRGAYEVFRLAATSSPRRQFSISTCLHRYSENVQLTDSYYHSSSNRRLVGMTIGQALDHSTAEHPEKTAFVYGNDGDRQTYRQLKDEVDRFAAGLLSIGIIKGDRVGIWGPNTREWIVTQYATARIGAILVNVNPAYRTSELEYALKKVGMKAIVSARNFKTQDYYEMLREICGDLGNSFPGNIRSQKLPDLTSIILMGSEKADGTFAFDDVLDMQNEENKASVEEISRGLGFDDPINIQFTSGTTGFPKATVLSHHGIVNNARAIGFDLGMEEEDSAVCCPIPLYHCAGMVGGSLCSVVSGSTCVLPSPSFEPAATVQSIQDQRCTIIIGTPTIYILLLNQPGFERYDTRSMRRGVMGGSTCPVQVLEELDKKLGMRLMPSFGMTECSPGVASAKVDDPLQPHCVGRPLGHIEAKIVDVSTGRITPVDEQGELCVRGYNVMKGYWGDEEKTREAIDGDGWFHTGDLASMSSEGHLSIHGRSKDMVIRGGTNIFPAEIEGFIHGHEDVEDVQIFGVPDEVMGEELCACVKLKQGASLTAEDIREFCREQITHYKIPRYIEFVQAFPMTATLKVQKFELQRMMTEKLGL